MQFPVIVLFIVFFLIAIRQIGNLRLKIWHIMLAGALVVLLTGYIHPYDALRAIDVDVMLFLFAMFVIGRALEESGYLAYISYKIFRRAKSADLLLLFILFGMGIGSALLVNDTLAIVGTPLVLLIAKKNGLKAKPLLLALAFSITIGSVISPIGNPQNFLIAQKITHPFTNFIKYLFIPTIINLLFAYFLLKFFYKDAFTKKKKIKHEEVKIKNNELANISKASLGFLLFMIAAKLFLAIFFNFDFNLTYVALIAMLPIILVSKRNVEIIRSIDWGTLVFFASMFILMQSVWQTNFFQDLFVNYHLNLLSIPTIFLVSIVLSQFISNVPLVALYLPLLVGAGAKTHELISLAAGSTIAGNLFILGAASNIIIIQHAEKHGETIKFLEFAKIGIPLTLINAIIYYFFLA